MKKVNTHETIHSSFNGKISELLMHLDSLGIYFSFKLADRLKERNLTMRDFAKMTGLRLATISDMCNGKKQSLNLHHVLISMIVLRISNIYDIIEIVFPEDIKVKFKCEAESWVRTGEVPEVVQILSTFLQGGYAGKSYVELEQDGAIIKNNRLLHDN